MTKNAYTLLFITAFSVIYLAAFVARRHGRYWYAQPSITDKAAASSDHHQQQKVPKSNGKPATSSDDNVSWLLRNLEDSFFPPPPIHLPLFLIVFVQKAAPIGYIIQIALAPEQG